jgi:ribosome-associated toxin RatA of RatAB toxin-antitoxin module
MTNSIVMAAPLPVVFAIAAAVETWPKFLPHYRWVRRLSGDDERRAVEMAARRGPLPVKWRSILEPRPEERRILFTHVGGAARGMTVAWTLTEEAEGTRATIEHWLTLDRPLIRTRLGRWIVAHWFIHPIATRTLRCMKAHVEAAAR